MILADLPLFASPAVPPLHRRRDPETSRRAGEQVVRRLGELHRDVLAVVSAAGARGMTGRELEELTRFEDCAPSTIRKRASELHRMGYLADGGRRDGMTVYVIGGRSL
jgi:hypothetical protein